jgi:MSHA biogenesis protein MshI
MSLLKSINDIFSKKQSNQLVGISLEQESLAFCSFSPQIETTSEKNSANSDTIFQHKKVNQLDFSQAITNLHSELTLAGKCHVVLSAQQSQIVQVDKPNVPELEINAALKWQIKDLVSIAPENMVLDYFEGPTLSGGQEKINVVCVAKSDLVEVVTTLTDDELNIKCITTEEFAFASLLPIQQDAVLFVCQQPNEEVNILIVKDGQLFFSRRLRGFAQIAGKSEDELSLGTIDALSLEIQRSTDYFERQLKQAPIKVIEVLIPMKHEAFLARKLAENTNVEVKLFAMPVTLESFRGSAVAIGATQLNFMEPN